MEASTRLCKNNDNPVANKRIRIIGLLNCAISKNKASDLFWGFNLLGPEFLILSPASTEVKPLILELRTESPDCISLLQNGLAFSSIG